MRHFSPRGRAHSCTLVPPFSIVPATDALLGLPPLGQFPCLRPPQPALLGMGHYWFVSRMLRNRRMHALHGNGPAARAGWQTVGSRGGAGLDARQLQDLQQAGTLRAAGWRLPTSVADSTPVRVYDTRVEPRWAEALMKELDPGRPLGDVHLIMGDFLTSPQPRLDDGQALAPVLSRWGPAGAAAYHIWVPPGGVV